MLYFIRIYGIFLMMLIHKVATFKFRRTFFFLSLKNLFPKDSQSTRENLSIKFSSYILGQYFNIIEAHWPFQWGQWRATLLRGATIPRVAPESELVRMLCDSANPSCYTGAGSPLTSPSVLLKPLNRLPWRGNTNPLTQILLKFRTQFRNMIHFVKWIFFYRKDELKERKKKWEKLKC